MRTVEELQAECRRLETERKEVLRELHELVTIPFNIDHRTNWSRN